MMRLDRGARTFDRNAFDDIRVERSLHQEIHRSDFFGLLLKDRYKFIADDFSFSFWIGDAIEPLKKPRARVHNSYLGFKSALEKFFDAVFFAFAKQTVIDKNAGELMANGFVQEACGHGGIHTARHCADDVT